jgi:hypothetical protein
VPSLVKPVAPDALAAMPTIRFKDDPRWAELHARVKAVLATREHVPRGRRR